MNERFTNEELARRDPNSEIPVRFARILLKFLADRRDTDPEVRDEILVAFTVGELTEVLDDVFNRSET